MATSSESRVVVLTGANRGIGYHMLKSLVEDGYRFAGLDVEGKISRRSRKRYPSGFRTTTVT